MRNHRHVPLFVMTITTTPTRGRTRRGMLLFIRLIPCTILFPVIVLAGRTQTLLLFGVSTNFRLNVLRHRLHLSGIVPYRLFTNLRLIRRVIHCLLTTTNTMVTNTPVILFLIMILRVTRRLTNNKNLFQNLDKKNQNSLENLIRLIFFYRDNVPSKSRNVEGSHNEK